MTTNIANELLELVDDASIEHLREQAPTPELRAVLDAALARRNGHVDNDGAPPAPEFPVDALPDPLRSLVIEGAAATDVDAAFLALPALAIFAGLIGPQARLQLKKSWVETAQIWTAVVAQPGRGKTPAEQIVRAGLHAIQREAYDQYLEAEEEYKSQYADWSNEPDGARGPRPEKPTLTNYLADDFTIEALAMMLKSRPGLVVLQDELTSWVQSHNQYRAGKGGDRSKWLKIWSAVPLKTNRKSSDPIQIDRPVVAVAGGIQPDMLPALAEEASRRDGFIERLLFAYPSDHIPGWTEDDISTATAQRVEAQMRAIATMGMMPEPVTLSPAAKNLFIEWHANNSRSLANVSGILEGIYAKLPAQLARLALIIHVLKSTWDTQNLRVSVTSASSVGRAIAPETIEDAIELVEYFRVHASLVVPLFGEPAVYVEGLSPERRRILAYHREHGPATSRQVADDLGMNPKSVNDMHRKLLARGLLYQPGYGSYAIPTPKSNSSSGGTGGSDGNSQILRLCPNCGGPVNATSGRCLSDGCSGWNNEARPF